MSMFPYRTFISIIFGIFLATWLFLVVIPWVNLGHLAPITEEGSTDIKPWDFSGAAHQGELVYAANGCAYCHSQQVQQDGTLVSVVMTDAGTNTSALADYLNQLLPGRKYMGPSVGAGLPKVILTNATIEDASIFAKKLKSAGAASQFRLVPTGPDIERAWGERRSVAQDFVMDATALPGSLRVGPDLSNEGNRHRDPNWQLVHLYNPAAVTPKSPMPAYKFLFTRKKIGKQASPDALQLTGEFKPDAEYEIVPTPEAKALVAYLSSLSSDTPLYEAPITPAAAPAAASTNAPTK